MANKLCLKVCQHFRHEIAALSSEPDFADTQLSTYPSFCERPQKDDSLKRLITKEAEQEFDVVLVGACFLGSAKKIPQVEHLKIFKTDQCLHFIAGQSFADHYMQQGAYLLTPGWLKDWPRRMAQWGFNQVSARQFFGECTTKLVLLDTGVISDSAQSLQNLADYLDLPAEIVPVGLDYFRLFMQTRVQSWRQDQAIREVKEATTLANQKTADYSMAFELLANLTKMRTEAEVVQGVLGTFTMLFAAKSLVYVPVNDNQLGKPHPGQVSDTDTATMQAWLENNTEEYTLLVDENGFRLRLTFQDETIGLLDVSDIAFPEYKHQYLNLALVMARLSSMAIVNARIFQQVQESANTDDLTGLSNRRFFFLTAQKELERAERYGRPLSAIMFDIDNFKEINDTYGHVTGDKVLIALADRCRTALRTTDILSRYGGDEYILILPEINTPEAHQVAERLRNDIASTPFETDGHTLTITISLGIATLGTNSSSLDELIRHCDEALYRAKAGGRNQTKI